MSVLMDTVRKLRDFPQPTASIEEQIVYEEIFYLFNCIEEEIQSVRDSALTAFRGVKNGSKEAHHVAREVYDLIKDIEQRNQVFLTWITNCFTIDYFPSTQDSVMSLMMQFDLTKEKIRLLTKSLVDILATEYSSEEFKKAYDSSEALTRTTLKLCDEMRKAKKLVIKKDDVA